MKLLLIILIAVLVLCCTEAKANDKIFSNTANGIDVFYTSRTREFPSTEQFIYELETYQAIDRNNYGNFYKGYMYGWKIKILEAK